MRTTLLTAIALAAVLAGSHVIAQPSPLRCKAVAAGQVELVEAGGLHA